MELTLSIKLGDNVQTLVPSIEAIRTLSAHEDDGLSGVALRCQKYHFETILKVLQVGLGNKYYRNIDKDIYEAGIINVANLCIVYINTLLNGGKIPTYEEQIEND